MIKKKILVELSVILFLTFAISFAQDKDTFRNNIQVKIDGYASDTLFIGYHLGSKVYVKDTTFVKNDAGYFLFKSSDTLDAGLYMIIANPDNNYFEFLIPDQKEQNFTITASIDSNHFFSNIKFTGSLENTMFTVYINFIDSMGTEKKLIEKKLTESNVSNKPELEKRLEGIDQEVLKYQDAIILLSPDYFISKFIKASKYPIIPESVRKNGQNSIFYYFREHFWDEFDFGSQGLIRTAFLENKLEYYITKLIVQQPDSIIVGIDNVLGKIIDAGNKKVFQFAVTHLLNKYARSKVVCMDKVYVHIGSKYYCDNNQAWWIAEEQLQKICRNVDRLRFSTCGKFAPQMDLIDVITNESVNLYAIKAKNTIVVFWDLKSKKSVVEIKILSKTYPPKISNEVEIFGVCNTKNESAEEYKNELTRLGVECINAYGESSIIEKIFELYNVTTYPTIFILDENKKIIIKQVGSQDVINYISRNNK